MKRTPPGLPAIALALASLALPAGCAREADGRPLVGVSFDTLQTEYWVASRDAMAAEIEARGARMLLAVANNDANRQFEQVNNFIARGVDGIIIAPKDSQIVLPMIKLASRAKIPIVLYNRPPAADVGPCVTVVADNFQITRDTVAFLAEKARAIGGKHRAMILIGDLGDANAIGRRDGFDAAIAAFSDVIEVVARVPTEWNQEKALAGVTNALQAHPDIDFIFSSSDFLFPSVVSALQQAGKYGKAGEPGHVLLAGFDGDATAYRMLADGHLDADGVQDVAYECRESVRAVFDLGAGRDVPRVLRDPGFVAHQGNLDEARRRMWGAKTAPGEGSRR
ncbi:D-ribose-binding periplasmic protein precursor [Aquisphaera giovannonii]|uniref:D-ribose-binding periplasmic protein n=1 Tax=Aquisphaera giovannonii TaxID=406548 RepID=A0A5B9W3L2_9BACT|nr:sugar ABC transporter substrate-binding protein [Aquisphaera giovannonii]QEH35178.1 D-ribose-binding periplasmic protein precursor [Aquisphaera giovannonii]